MSDKSALMEAYSFFDGGEAIVFYDGDSHSYVVSIDNNMFSFSNEFADLKVARKFALTQIKVYNELFLDDLIFCY